VVVNDAGLFQYTTANNSTVTQATSKSTAVTCNGRTGQITTNNASLAKGATVSFTVNNAQIVSAKDVVIVNISSGATSSSYTICVDAVAIGSFSISITNNGAGPLAEALVINYAIIRVQ
jgi:DNA-binding MurR/RpiR family transcriptional regulator